MTLQNNSLTCIDQESSHECKASIYLTVDDQRMRSFFVGKREGRLKLSLFDCLDDTGGGVS